MRTAIWRVVRTGHDGPHGQLLAPIDHNRRSDAVDLIRQLQRAGADGHLQQWNEFTGEWVDTDPT